MRKEYVERFKEKYYRFAPVMDSKYWELILELVDNDGLKDKMMFANDVLKVPPVKTFIMLNNLENEEFTNPMKQNIGAAFGCLFMEFLGYKDKYSVSCRIANVKTASIFIK